MFVIVSHYKAPIEAVDRLMAEHRAWLAPLFDSGTFVLAGRREPRSGGLMLARGMTRQALLAELARDPFRQADLLTHEIFEFVPTTAHRDLAWLTE